VHIPDEEPPVPHDVVRLLRKRQLLQHRHYHPLTRSRFPFNEPQTVSIHINGVIAFEAYPEGNCTELVPKVTVQLLHSCVFQRCNVLSFPKEEPCQRSSAVSTFFCPLSSARRSLCVT
jgi:hypothetical protein